jgi:hypothetical protein
VCTLNPRRHDAWCKPHRIPDRPSFPKREKTNIGDESNFPRIRNIPKSRRLRRNCSNTACAIPTTVSFRSVVTGGIVGSIGTADAIVAIGTINTSAAFCVLESVPYLL